MKSITILLAAVLITLGVQAQKLSIVHENWTEAQTLAKKEGKLIIIDFYTTWCGPCKFFSANLKTNHALQEKLSREYIMLKYDAEKDKEFYLNRKFHIAAYPTFVIVSSQLQYIDRLIGGSLEDEASIERFVKFTDAALQTHRAKKYPKGYNTRLDNDYPSFYTKAKDREWKYNAEDISNYWASNNDFTSEASFAVLSSYGGTEQVEAYFLNNKEIFDEKFGISCTDGMIENMANRKISAALKAKDEKMFAEGKAFMKKHLDADMVANAMPGVEMRFAVATENCTKIEDLVKDMKAQNTMGVNEVNSICWTVYESPCEKTSLLNTTQKWMESIAEDERDYNFLDTYACILYKNKKYKEAKAYMEIAIARAKADDLDYEASKEVLLLIEKELK